MNRGGMVFLAAIVGILWTVAAAKAAPLPPPLTIIDGDGDGSVTFLYEASDYSSTWDFGRMVGNGKKFNSFNNLDESADPLLNPQYLTFADGATVQFALEIGGTLYTDYVASSPTYCTVCGNVTLDFAGAGAWVSLQSQSVGDGVQGDAVTMPNPEPMSLVLMSSSMVVGFGFLRWRRKKSENT